MGCLAQTGRARVWFKMNSHSGYEGNAISEKPAGTGFPTWKLTLLYKEEMPRAAIMPWRDDTSGKCRAGSMHSFKLLACLLTSIKRPTAFSVEAVS